MHLRAMFIKQGSCCRVLTVQAAAVSCPEGGGSVQPGVGLFTDEPSRV